MKSISIDDLVRLERVSDPQASPDGQRVAYQLRETDYAANRANNSLWLRELSGPDVVSRRLTGIGADSSAPRWSHDGSTLYFLAARGGLAQVWKLNLADGATQPITQAPLAIGSFMPAPDGRTLLVSMDVFPDGANPHDTRARLDAHSAHKPSGLLHERLFVRHWDRWARGTRSQLFIYRLDERGIAAGEPLWLTRGIDGDVPSRPEGDDGEYCYTPDGRTLYALADDFGQRRLYAIDIGARRHHLHARQLERAGAVVPHRRWRQPARAADEAQRRGAHRAGLWRLRTVPLPRLER